MLKSGLELSKRREEYLGRNSLKSIHISVRMDPYTYQAIKEIAKLLKKRNVSEILRMSVWYMLILTSPKLTVKKAFKEEALEDLMNNKDVVLVDAFKNFNELIKEVFNQQSSSTSS